MPSTKPTLPGRRSTVLCSAWSCTAPSRRTSLPHWGSATGNFMSWPTRLEILLARAAGARRTEDVAGFGTRHLVDHRQRHGYAHRHHRLPREQAICPRLRMDARNQAGCGYEGGRTVKPAPLRYSRPGSTAGPRRWRCSRRSGDDGKVLAGGQSLVPLLSMRLAAPDAPGRHQPGGRARLRHAATTAVRVGALARHAQVERDRRRRRPPSPCWPRRCGSSPTRPSATAGRRSAASCTPTRPGR